MAINLLTLHVHFRKIAGGYFSKFSCEIFKVVFLFFIYRWWKPLNRTGPVCILLQHISWSTWWSWSECCVKGCLSKFPALWIPFYATMSSGIAYYLVCKLWINAVNLTSSIQQKNLHTLFLDYHNSLTILKLITVPVLHTMSTFWQQQHCLEFSRPAYNCYIIYNTDQ